METTGSPFCSVVIVNWNGGRALKTCLESIQRFEDFKRLQVIVSDNGSTDGSLDMLREDFSWVEVIQNNKNIGFAAGNNRGFDKAKSDFVLMLNPDMELVEPLLKKMIAHMEEKPEVGACGCMVKNHDWSFMKQCRRGYPDPLTAFFKVTGLTGLFPGNKRIGKYFYSGIPADKTMNVDAISGSFMLLRKTVIEKVGGLREEFFMYVEDVDFCRRIREAGYRVRYLPVAKIVHHGGACVEQRPRRNIFYHYHMTRSHLILYTHDRQREGGGIGYHVAFVLILARYELISLLNLNFRLLSDLLEFFRIHLGQIKIAKVD